MKNFRTMKSPIYGIFKKNNPNDKNNYMLGEKLTVQISEKK